MYKSAASLHWNMQGLHIMKSIVLPLNKNKKTKLQQSTPTYILQFAHI